MYKVITSWNFLYASSESRKKLDEISLRGKNRDVFLTGEFAQKIAEQQVRPLSVSNIADKNCPTRRDLYFFKGINRLPQTQHRRTWGNRAGYTVQGYVEGFLKTRNTCNSYSDIGRKGTRIHKKFVTDKITSLNSLRGLEGSTYAKEGDTDWLLDLLGNNGRTELGLNLLNSHLREKNSLCCKHMKTNQGINPIVTEIGINSPATPDFIAPRFRLVGDVKTGDQFLPKFLLTCAGYALAYENENGQSKIDWGAIYFFPTRIPSDYVKPITFSQVYFFPIDDSLREWFIDVRDEGYRIISRDEPPDFPREGQREECHYCRFNDHCVETGLELTTHS